MPKPCNCCNEDYTVAYQSIQNTVQGTEMSLIDFGFTAQEVSDARRVYVFINSGALRVDWSGNIPTTAIGAIQDGWFELKQKQNIQKLLIVRNGATDAEVFIILEK